MSVTITSNNTIQITGELSFNSAAEILSQSEVLLAKLPTCTFDLSQLSKVDSAGVALLATLLGQAKKLGKEIVFRHVPKELFALSSVSGLDKILPMEM